MKAFIDILVQGDKAEKIAELIRCDDLPSWNSTSKSRLSFSGRRNLICLKRFVSFNEGVRGTELIGSDTKGWNAIKTTYKNKEKQNYKKVHKKLMDN